MLQQPATNILCISSIDWDFIWQGHQEIMAAFAEQGHRVLFIENTGVRSPRLQDLPRLRLRVRNWWRGVKGFRQERQNLFVYSPLVLPFPYSRVARLINRTLLIRSLRLWMRTMGFHRPIIWSYLPTPLALDLIDALDAQLTIYYCVADLASSSPAATRINRGEVQLFKQADLVFVDSEEQRQRASRYRQQVHLFPSGVNFQLFEQVRLSYDGIPEELRDLPHPIAGYVGGIHQWVDQDLLGAVIKRMPEVSFVLVGPIQSDVSRLTGHPNVHFLGARAHHEIPHYIKGFDAALIPYRLNRFTASVYPSKLNEYLAMGVPVVTTDLPEIRRFNDQHQGIVAVGGDPEAFTDAIRTAVALQSPLEVERRLAVARQNSWSVRINQMTDLIEKAIAVKKAEGEPWEEVFARLYRTARRRVMKAGAVTLAAYLLVFHTPLLWVVADPLRITGMPHQADAIVVFAGGAGELGKPGSGHQERAKQAIDLYQDGRAPWVIFSSGDRPTFQEARALKALAVEYGVPSSAIILETKAASTYQMVVLVGAILHQNGMQSILLVSSPYHMRRALWTFRKMVPEITVVPAPVPHSRFYSHTWGADLEQIHGILHEYAAILFYWWKGWV